MDIELQHYRQRFDWDCGISCVLMLLNEADRQQFLDNFQEICEYEKFGESTWTIDLCYLLNRYNVKHMFYTVTYGVRKAYKCNVFYKNVYIKDEVRVNRKFEEAPKQGITIKQDRVNLEDILTHLASSNPILILVNANSLRCVFCDKSGWLDSTYLGHYVVLCGFDCFQQLIHYRNPAKTNHVCSANFDCFEDSRTCFGTDEDVIFVYRK